MPEKRFKPFLQNLILLFFGIILSFFIFELYLRLAYPSTSALYICDPLIGFKFAPNQKTKYITPEFNVTIETNSAGFRDKEWIVEKTPGLFRIAVLGDSFMSGLQVPHKDLFTTRLENKLNMAGSNVKFEVINFGLDGMGTAQEYEILRHYGLKYKPDLVILAFFAENDIRNNMPQLNYFEYAFRHIPYYKLNEDGDLEYVPFNTPSGLKIGFRNFIKKNFRTATFITARLRQNPHIEGLLVKMGLLTDLLHKEKNGMNNVPPPLFLCEKRYQPIWQEGWDVTEKLLLEMKRLCRENGAEFFIMNIAHPAHVIEGIDEYFRAFPKMKRGEWDFLKPYKLLKSFCRKKGIDYVDLFHSFKAYYRTTGRPPYFLKNRHMNSEGMELAAEAVLKKLARKRLIPAGAH